LKQSAVVETKLIDGESVFPLELNTMPGWAGSSQYFNRYMDPHNEDEIYSQDAITYWQDVDLYIGGSEHATGHLLYSRFWQKFMFDRGLVPVDEFAKKLINQGMITGTSALVYRLRLSFKQTDIIGNVEEYLIGFDRMLKSFHSLFVSFDYVKMELGEKESIKFSDNKFLKVRDFLEVYNSDKIDLEIVSVSFDKVHAKVNLVDSSDKLDIDGFKNWQTDYSYSHYLRENGNFTVGREVEKMSKSKYNVVNPDAICEEYGADSLRMYEMFLGPLEQSKPWNTAGITGVHGFLKKLWKLYHSGPNGEFKVTDINSDDNVNGVNTSSEPSNESFKILHKTIKKVEDDIQNFSFNTSVSTFMICVNELTGQNCTSREILEPLSILISPYAPHITEELWHKLGHAESISTAPFPKFKEKYVVESSKKYPISFNGKMRFTMELPLDLDKQQIEDAVMAHEKTQQQLDGRTPKKVIVVPGKIVNIVG
ncbi:hypothetical protein LCGC14_0869790, partial [marine sediment metagenome]